MKSQWDALLENLGAWEGSFTRLSPQGEAIADMPTQVSLEAINDRQTIRQTIRRYAPDAQDQVTPQDQVLEYSSLGRGVLLFENGAFSQGSTQLGPFSEFGAEFGFIAGDRRLRLVPLYDRQSQLSQITLIREKRSGTDAPDRPPLTLEALLGTWEGEATTLYPDWRSPDSAPTQLTLIQLAGDRLQQTLTFGAPPTTLTSTAEIRGQSLLFSQGSQSVQVLLLPDGASVTAPTQLQMGKPCFLEAGWLLAPDLRQRMIRAYDEKGGWASLTLVTERKVAEP
ncbi:DUF3598 family protein [Geitlerinema sp. PCC 7407]|uniref:DUF3598 family protein n=1 Tax=Geitlerinema sp. PCC 7407 TaxID=1173025 RepID=UPI00029FB133|nr:DUF3598 family protein [Geitlerinema sp. PCC 7407]AFY64937.1 hypothetical protein GEI7407_0436 [Geitlerinema sp. PCC 7407]